MSTMLLARSSSGPLACLAFLLVVVTTVTGAPPTVKQALQLVPIQKNVDYDKPAAKELATCTLDAAKQTSGWVVRGPDQRILRNFLDTTGNNKIDQWCYYKDGIEVYRDIDSDRNGKADQYRWLGTSGTRWGTDSNEDGTIDAWKIISAEELSREVVESIQARDVRRFRSLLITQEELKSLGLGKTQRYQITSKVSEAVALFDQAVRQQQLIQPESTWVHFSGTQPGIIAAGTDGSTKDLIIYDNVVAMIETAGKHSQVVIGTIIRVDDKWRIFDLPGSLLAGRVSANTGYFFHTSLSRPAHVQAPENPVVNEDLQKLLAELDRADKKVLSALTTADKARLNSRRADLLDQIVEKTEDKEQRTNWIRQLADMLSATGQSGDYPAGSKRLKTLYDKLAGNPENMEQVPYVKFRYLTTAYATSLQGPGADFAKIQEKWLKNLTEFIEQFPDNPDSFEAMLQLAIAQEFAGDEAEAKRWYGILVSHNPDSSIGKKAAGAKRRLEIVGQPLALQGHTVGGKRLRLSSLRGKIVLLHYWATWCEPCKDDLVELKRLYARYGARGFIPVGVTVDSDRKVLNDYLKQNRLSWPQLFEAGGLDGRLANELGILILPTMLLLDKDGKVINRNIHISELSAELDKRLSQARN